MIKKPKQLAEEHWAWIESVLADRQQETKHMFIEGFIHGFKHGKEEKIIKKTKEGRGFPSYVKTTKVS